MSPYLIYLGFGDMDLTLIFTTFTTVLLAELGDKTQLATLVISGSSKRPIPVFLASSSALVLASLIGALAGGSLATVIPADLVKLLASFGFIFIGLRLLWPLLATHKAENQHPNTSETDQY